MMQSNNPRRYDDLLGLPHPDPQTRLRMSRHDRAAQFAPFAALPGHGAVMDETARLTDPKVDPDELQADALNAALAEIRAHIRSRPQVQITFFVPDAQKAGGEYRTIDGCVRRIAEAERFLQLTDGTKIPLDDLLSVAQITNTEVVTLR